MRPNSGGIMRYVLFAVTTLVLGMTSLYPSTPAAAEEVVFRVEGSEVVCAQSVVYRLYLEHGRDGGEVYHANIGDPLPPHEDREVIFETQSCELVRYFGGAENYLQLWNDVDTCSLLLRMMYLSDAPDEWEMHEPPDCEIPVG